MSPIVIGAIAGGLGALFGYAVRHVVALSRRDSIETDIQDKIIQAKKEANKIEEDALHKASLIREEHTKSEERLMRLEERVLLREKELEAKEDSLKAQIRLFEEKNISLVAEKNRLEEKEQQIEMRYESIAGVSREEAYGYIVNSLKREHEEDLHSRMIKLSYDGENRLEEKARDILVNSVYRLANSSSVNSFFTSAVVIPDEEVKGKIIGKEGRNIKTFERASGVELLVDESPNSIVVSCFDPVRRAIAVNALEALIKDGRIQPAKIEELLDKAKKDLGIFMKKKGEEAVIETNVITIPEAIIPLLGRLYFRTSYGQNVLTHSIEMAHIAGMLANELGADSYVAKAGALLHDIGKAVDHEIQGTHVEIGRKILMKYGVDERVILAMQAHHEEYPYETIESVLVQVADAISGGRPGARRDTVDRYITRLSDLEALAMAFQGIEKVYALQAGREIRVFVSPSLVSDLEARDLARQIALRIEAELRYPGEIKVHVIRESRVIEVAR